MKYVIVVLVALFALYYFGFIKIGGGETVTPEPEKK